MDVSVIQPWGFMQAHTYNCNSGENFEIQAQGLQFNALWKSASVLVAETWLAVD